MTPFDARRAYDRIGRLQDTQSFYERPAVDDLVAHLRLGTARNVLEIGCGTGKLAERLLRSELPGTATYLATEVSETMVRLAGTRLRPFGERAQVDLVGADEPLPQGPASFDRVIATYVFDLLSDDDTDRILAEAHERLAPDGLLGLVSLTPGASGIHRLASDSWTAIWRRFPSLVGGCRPVSLLQPLEAAGFRAIYRHRVAAWGLTSEVTTATPG